MSFFLIFIATGWLNIYSSALNEDHLSIFDVSQKYGKQLNMIIASFVIIFGIMLVEAKFYERFASIIYIISIIFLIGLFVFGKEVSGAKSWYGFGSLSIQPSEFVKVATALAIAKYLSSFNIKINTIGTQLALFTILLIPMLLIILQPDPGSALVYLFFIFVLYREGLSGHYILLAFLTISIFILDVIINYRYILFFITAVILLIGIYKKSKRKKYIYLVLYFLYTTGILFSFNFIYNNVLEDRHRNRIEILLDVKHDPSGVGYNQHQSIVAIGSGEWTGKGYLQGTQTKGSFVPEQSTDFIFCTVGEEWGFLGSTLVVILFTAFIARILYKAELQKSQFSRIYGYSVAIIFFFHFSVNIAMAIGIAPVVGIPLPFYSYGGSSLWGFSILLFIFIRLDSENHNIL